MGGTFVAEGNGWTPDKRFVEESLIRIERDLREQTEHLDKTHASIFRSIGTIREEIVALKIKAGVWGLLGGLIPVVIALALYIAFKT